MGLRAIGPFHRHRRNRDLPLKRPGLSRVVQRAAVRVREDPFGYGHALGPNRLRADESGDHRRDCVFGLEYGASPDDHCAGTRQRRSVRFVDRAAHRTRERAPVARTCQLSCSEGKLGARRWVCAFGQRACELAPTQRRAKSRSQPPVAVVALTGRAVLRGVGICNCWHVHTLLMSVTAACGFLSLAPIELTVSGYDLGCSEDVQIGAWRVQISCGCAQPSPWRDSAPWLIGTSGSQARASGRCSVVRLQKYRVEPTTGLARRQCFPPQLATCAGRGSLVAAFRLQERRQEPARDDRCGGIGAVLSREGYAAGSPRQGSQLKTHDGFWFDGDR